MAQQKTTAEQKMSDEEREAQEKAELLKANARRISNQILVLARNSLFVSLRFLDIALCQFEYLSSEKLKTIATTGQHLVYNPKYVIERYMNDKQALAHDYLHIVIHCIFRHPFVSTNLDEHNWNLACDIAAEGIIADLDVKQARVKNSAELTEEIESIRGRVKQMTAEYLYQYLQSGAPSEHDIEKWKRLFVRDDHTVWWELARQIEEEMRRRAEEAEREKEQNQQNQNENQESDSDSDENPEDSENDSEEDSAEDAEDQDDNDSDDADENNDEESEGEGDSDESDEDSDEESDEESDENAEDGESQDSENPEDEDDESENPQDGENDEPEPEEDDLAEEDYEDEYSSTPGQSMERENSDDVPDPDSDTEDTGEENDDSGSGGGNPGEDPEQSEEEGDERKNDTPTDGLDGQSNDAKPGDDRQKPQNTINGSEDENKSSDSREDDPFGDENQQHGNSNPGQDAKQTNSKNAKHGEHTAGTGGGGDGEQSAWEHSSGDSTRRGGGEKNPEAREQLEGEADLESEQEEGADDGKRQSAEATEGQMTDEDQEEKEPSFMHSESEHKELEDKWKDISERLLVDLETSSKEWGDKSDAMLMGIKKVNRDKYDYSTFLQKFSTLKEDIQINVDEFDYVYYTYGLEKYGNIPLIEPLEYKEMRKVRDFVIAIDTSGSCAGEVVQKFLDKTYSIFSQQENFFRKINLHIIQCDAEIQSDVKITCKEEFDAYIKDLQFRGFGGTDFRPVFEYVNQMIEHKEFDELKGLIYFTDGNGTYPKKRPPYETAFVFVDDDEFEYEVPSWAMKLVLETSDITEEIQL